MSEPQIPLTTTKKKINSTTVIIAVVALIAIIFLMPSLSPKKAITPPAEKIVVTTPVTKTIEKPVIPAETLELKIAPVPTPEPAEIMTPPPLTYGQLLLQSQAIALEVHSIQQQIISLHDSITTLQSMIDLHDKMMKSFDPANNSPKKK